MAHYPLLTTGFLGHHGSGSASPNETCDGLCNDRFLSHRIDVVESVPDPIHRHDHCVPCFTSYSSGITLNYAPMEPYKFWKASRYNVSHISFFTLFGECWRGWIYLNHTLIFAFAVSTFIAIKLSGLWETVYCTMLPNYASFSGLIRCFGLRARFGLLSFSTCSFCSVHLMIHTLQSCAPLLIPLLRVSFTLSSMTPNEHSG